MKINLLLFILLWITTSFHLHEGDYRDVYTGSYFCNSSCQLLNKNHTGTNIYADTTTIVISKHQQDSVLSVLVHGREILMILRDNNLVPFKSYLQYRGRFYSSDSLAFTSSETHTPNICIYKGGKN